MAKDIEDYDLPFVTSNTESILNERELMEYKRKRKRFARWLLTEGKNTEKGRGYSESTVQDTLYRTDKVFRWAWDEYDQIKLNLTHERADHFLTQRVQVLDEKKAPSEVDNAGYLKALKRLFNWRTANYGADEWDPTYSFSSDLENGHHQPKLDKEEINLIEDAVLSYGTFADRQTTSVHKRDDRDSYLAQRLGIKKENITEKHWDRTISWKFPSLISVGIDAGLRPKEVERAKTNWYQDGNLVIPAEDSVKSDDSWEVALSQKTQDRLDAWLEERDQFEKYDDSEIIWLTREGNPYGSSALAHVLERVFELADLDKENCHWYMLRRHLATQLADQKSKEHARDQMRHKSSRSTERYISTPTDQRREGVEGMRSD